MSHHSEFENPRENPPPSRPECAEVDPHIEQCFSVFNCVWTPIVVVDEIARLWFVNLSACDRLGYRDHRRELIGKRLSIVMPTQRELQVRLDPNLQGAEILTRCRDGSPLPTIQSMDELHTGMLFGPNSTVQTRLFLVRFNRDLEFHYHQDSNAPIDEPPSGQELRVAPTSNLCHRRSSDTIREAIPVRNVLADRWESGSDQMSSASASETSARRLSAAEHGTTSPLSSMQSPDYQETQGRELRDQSVEDTVGEEVRGRRKRHRNQDYNEHQMYQSRIRRRAINEKLRELKAMLNLSPNASESFVLSHFLNMLGIPRETSGSRAFSI